MVRAYRLALPLALLLLIGPAEVGAQWNRPYPGPGWSGGGLEDLSGSYVNTSNGGRCQVTRVWGGYRFVNENGSPARFAFVGPGQLRMTSGTWDPNTLVTVQRGRSGRPVLCFQGPDPSQPADYWVAQD